MTPPDTRVTSRFHLGVAGGAAVALLSILTGVSPALASASSIAADAPILLAKGSQGGGWTFKTVEKDPAKGTKTITKVKQKTNKKGNQVTVTKTVIKPIKGESAVKPINEESAPEPITLLGSLAAIGVGSRLSKAHLKKQLADS
jgi:hypothetical protein